MKFQRGTLEAGFMPETLEQPIYMRGGAAALYDVRQLDITASDAAVTSITTFGGATDGFSNAIAVGSNISAGIYVAVTKAAADDAEGKAALCGILRVKCNTGVTAGQLLTPIASQVYLDDIAAGAATARAVAIALEDLSATVTGTCLCLFDGVNGFGTDLAS